MGVAASPNSERAGLNDPLALRVPDCKFGLRHIEAHSPGFMRFQMNARKTPQRTLRGLDARRVLTEIELDHFISLVRARVGNLNADAHRIAQGRSRSLDKEMCIAESCVAKAEAKWEECLTVIVDILPLPRWIGIVEVRELPQVARETHGKPDCYLRRVSRRLPALQILRGTTLREWPAHVLWPREL